MVTKCRLSREGWKVVYHMLAQFSLQHCLYSFLQTNFASPLRYMYIKQKSTSSFTLLFALYQKHEIEIKNKRWSCFCTEWRLLQLVVLLPVVQTKPVIQEDVSLLPDYLHKASCRQRNVGPGKSAHICECT